MLCNIEKDRKKRFLFSKHEKTRVILKSICKNFNLSIRIRNKASLDLAKLPKSSSKVRYRNRCVLTGRGRFLFTSFCLSRLTLRKLAFKGLIPGMRKASW